MERPKSPQVLGRFEVEWIPSGADHRVWPNRNRKGLGSWLVWVFWVPGTCRLVSRLRLLLSLEQVFEVRSLRSQWRLNHLWSRTWCYQPWYLIWKSVRKVQRPEVINRATNQYVQYGTLYEENPMLETGDEERLRWLARVVSLPGCGVSKLKHSPITGDAQGIDACPEVRRCKMYQATFLSRRDRDEPLETALYIYKYWARYPLADP